MPMTAAEKRLREHKAHCTKCPRCKEGRGLRQAVDFYNSIKRQREHMKEMQRLHDLPDFDKPVSYRKPLRIEPER